MPAKIRHPQARSSGFSLVEIMVGILIGMFGMIVMMQVFALSESQKRATTGGGDAQTNGAIALFSLQREIQLSGYGSSMYNLIGCNVALPAGWTINAMAPVTINHASIPAGDANTDTLLVVYGNTNGSPEGDGITAQPAATTYTVQTPTSFANGDAVIALAQTRPLPCNLTMTTVTGVNTATAQISVAAGAAVSSGGLYNLGQTPNVKAYAVRGGNLTECDYTVNNCGSTATTGSSTVWVPIANNIVSLRAQYGRDTLTVPITYTTPPNPLPNYVVDTYDQSTPTNNAATTNCRWVRIPVVRLALVARSAEYDKTVLTATAPTWAGAPTVPINLSGNTTWQNYRYRVFQTVVPIRNIAWLGVQSGC